MTNVRRTSKVGQHGVTQGPPKDPALKPMTDRAEQALMYARGDARHPQVTTCDLLLGILRMNGGLAAQVLMNLGVTFEKAQAEVGRMEKPR